MRRLHKRMHRRLRRHQKRLMNVLEVVRLYGSMPVGI